MKKYVKPELFYESFELSQQIAACDFDSNDTSTDSGCQFTGDATRLPNLAEMGVTGIVTIFTSGCRGNNMIQYEAYCYHNSNGFGSAGIFNS